MSGAEKALMDFPTTTESGVPLPIRPQAIAFDLDGTLLDHDGVLSDAVARAVRRISRSGIRVFIVTGRLQSGAERHWRAIEPGTPIACCNGAHIGFPGEAPLRHARLSKTVRRKIVDIDSGSGLYFNYAVDNTVYALKDGPEREFYSRVFSPVSLAGGPEEILALPAPTKCLCVTSEAEQPAALALLREALGDGAQVTTSNSRFIEIIPPGVDKGAALDFLAHWMGVTPDAFIAVGDAMNDAPMMEKAGFAVSFTSGDPGMREHADMLLPPLWEEGMRVLAGRVLGIAGSERVFKGK